ncbi:hypothetical protein [Edaphobacter modestus]|uniref:Uncharacterized protein n=1 Tax=Edaphobacter modestus TaxID=388466 RepID=A0A4Q7YST3_9BACT|nr:hypothetical protein [Edaphobacter modestus]RZU39905.1 hypothetical protein BDD14_1305 [Edaphobacter modestus]
MSPTSTSSRQALLLVSAFFALLLIACGKKATSPASMEQAKQAVPTQPAYSPDEPPPPLNGIALPKSYGRDTGDLDVMVKRRNIRALLILSPIMFGRHRPTRIRGLFFAALKVVQTREYNETEPER